MRRGGHLTRALAFAFVVLVAAAVGACSSSSATQASTSTDPGTSTQSNTSPDPKTKAVRSHDQRPNIVLIQTDDQALTQFSKRYMPNVTKLLAARGTVFSHAYMTTPDCCPSRAALITGQYGHNNGVLRNAYSLLKHKSNVLPVWLRRAGYVTAHIGKFLNPYHHLEPAPGWTQWHTLLKPGRYYNYDLSVNGREVHRGDKPQDYVTRVFTRTAVRMIHRYVPRRRPLYLQVDEVAPHVSRGGHTETPECNPLPDPRDRGKFSHTPLPRPPSFDEPDMKDKPVFMRGIPPLSQDNIDHMTRNFRCGLAALRSVDRGVGRIYDAIKRSGELRRTVFIFCTDNGVFYGQHRLALGKLNPYQEAVSTPLVMRVPDRYVGGRTVARVSTAVANIDYAPTILRLAHGKPCQGQRCRIMDGRPLQPLIGGKRPGWAKNRPVGMEIALKHGSAQHLAACEYTGVHVGNRTFVKYRRVQKPGTNKCVRSRDFEEYNLASDPFQLRNLCFGGDPHSCPNRPSTPRLRKDVKRIRHCAGIAGRDPRTAGRPYCG